LLTSFGTQYFIRRMPAPESTRRALGETVLIDVRAAGSALELMVKVAGRIARVDDGIGIPFVVASREDKERARRLVADAEAASSEAGYDYEGLVRLSDSFPDGTIALIEETDATLTIVDWTGPGVGIDLFFGTEIDSVGSDSPAATVAAHLVEPWERVIVIPGSSHVPWHAEDARLVLEVAERLRGGDDESLLVVAPDESLLASHHEMEKDYEFVAASLPGDVLLEVMKPTDLVVVPAYLLPEMPFPRRLRLSSSLAHQNLAIVAGPGRLAVAPRSLPHAMERILGPVQ
jgi:hypothetical protein